MVSGRWWPRPWARWVHLLQARIAKKKRVAHVSFHVQRGQASRTNELPAAAKASLTATLFFWRCQDVADYLVPVVSNPNYAHAQEDEDGYLAPVPSSPTYASPDDEEGEADI